MRPPFDVTPRAATLLSEMERMLGRYEGAQVAAASPLLRRSQRVKTIQASLAIEGNTLTEEQVTAVLEGKRIIAPERDLREVKNAIRCYDKLPRWDPSSTAHLLAAHEVMMNGLVGSAGAWRKRGVGIAKGDVIAHVAPPADRVPGQMKALLDWVGDDGDVPLPVRAAVCHYELEFIHPFEDGNGRLGRLWHSLILFRHHKVFAHVPVESAIRDRQADYYAVLGLCDRMGKSDLFIEFSLELTLQALASVVSLPAAKMKGSGRMTSARERFGKNWFSRKEYQALFTHISPATASRDLQGALKEGILARDGDKATARYRFQAE